MRHPVSGGTAGRIVRAWPAPSGAVPRHRGRSPEHGGVSVRRPAEPRGTVAIPPHDGCAPDVIGRV